MVQHPSEEKKFVQYGGPDGGNGGNGGNVYFLGNNNLSSFKDISQKGILKPEKVEMVRVLRKMEKMVRI